MKVVNEEETLRATSLTIKKDPQAARWPHALACARCRQVWIMIMPCAHGEFSFREFRDILDFYTMSVIRTHSEDSVLA